MGGSPFYHFATSFQKHEQQHRRMFSNPEQALFFVHHQPRTFFSNRQKGGFCLDAMEGRENILTDTPVVLLGPEQPVQHYQWCSSGLQRFSLSQSRRLVQRICEEDMFVG